MALAEAAPREVLKDVTAAAWSPDGAELAIVRQVEGRSRLEYPIGKVLAETTSYVSDVRIAPHGDLIAYMPHEFTNDNRGRVVVADRDGKVVATSPEYWGEEGLAWSADGERVLYSASEKGGDVAIQELALDGSVRTVLAAPVGLILHDVSADGRLLALDGVFAGRASSRCSPGRPPSATCPGSSTPTRRCSRATAEASCSATSRSFRVTSTRSAPAGRRLSFGPARRR